jgi:hypothetical protein
VKITLGHFTASVAGLDGLPCWTNIRKERFPTVAILHGEREDLLGILYAIEACPAFWSGESPMLEVSALRRTSRRWRKLLGLSETEKVPTPAWARAS